MPDLISILWIALVFAALLVLLFGVSEIERKARTKRRNAARVARREASAAKKNLAAPAPVPGLIQPESPEN